MSRHEPFADGFGTENRGDLDIELVAAPENTAGARRREADRAQALPGADEPMPPKARVDQSRCAAAQAKVDPALACALAFLDAGGIDSFLKSVTNNGDEVMVTR